MQTRKRRDKWKPFSVFLTVLWAFWTSLGRRFQEFKKTTTTPCFPGPGVRARVVVAFPLKGLIGLGRILQVDSRGGLSIPTATPRTVLTLYEYSFPAACGAGPPSCVWGRLFLWITIRDVPVYGASCPHLWGDLPLFMGRNVPVYGGAQNEMSLFMGNAGRRHAAFCG